MASNKPVIHGRDHRPGGSDPVFTTEGIRYDFDNEGDWLDIHATGTDGDGFGIHFDSVSPVKFGSADLFTIEADSLTLHTTGATADLALHSEYNAEVQGDRHLQLTGGVDAVAGAGVDIDATHGNLNIVTTDALATMTLQSDNLVFDCPPKQTTPVTLGDVIVLLQAYGLAV